MLSLCTVLHVLYLPYSKTKYFLFQLQCDILPGDLPSAHGGDGGLLPGDGAQPLGQRGHRYS